MTKFGIWSIAVKQKQTDEWDVEEAAWELLRRLPDNPQLWLSLPQDSKVRLSFALALQSFNQGFSVEPQMARYVAERSIGMDFHIYREDEENA